MKFGTRFPLVAMNDAAAYRDFARAIDQAGINYVTLAGHVLSAEANRYPERPTATYAGPFADHFTMFAHLAAVTEQLEFMSGILILPLFPTALAAKQAAELSWLSGGRYHMGVGISWHLAEYEALGEDIHNRGKRIEEQVVVMRRLWSEPYVSFEGQWHKLDRVGLNRLPAAPIPIWMGSGTEERILRRVARVADGWAPMGDATEPMSRLKNYLTDAGRDPATFLLASSMTAGSEGPAAWVDSARKLESIGATHITIGAPPDLAGPQALERVIEARNVLAAEFGG